MLCCQRSAKFINSVLLHIETTQRDNLKYYSLQWRRYVMCWTEWLNQSRLDEYMRTLRLKIDQQWRWIGIIVRCGTLSHFIETERKFFEHIWFVRMNRNNLINAQITWTLFITLSLNLIGFSSDKIKEPKILQLQSNIF